MTELVCGLIGLALVKHFHNKSKGGAGGEM